MQYNVSDFCKEYAERYVLSKAVNNIDFYYTLVSKVNKQDFLDVRHSTLFGVLKMLNEKYDIKSFEFFEVERQLESLGATELIDAKYLDLLYNFMDSDPGNFDRYVNDILEASTKYQLFKKINNTSIEILEDLSRGSKDSGQFIGQIQSDIMSLSTQAKSIKEPVNVCDGLLDYLEERRKEYKDMSGISTGYPILDTQIDGLIPGTLFIVAARKKMGKSAFITNMAAHIALVSEKPLLYVDTEMTFSEWRDRLISMVTGIPERIIKHGGYDDATYTKITKAIKIFEGKKFFHEYMPGYSLDKITALYKKYKIKEDIQAAFFDYIKEPESTSINTQRKEYQILGDVATRLKDLSGDLNIPFVTAVQLNRQGDIADSDRIARYGDIVSFWMAQETSVLETYGGKCGPYKLVIKDSRRGGGTGDTGIGYNFFKEMLFIKEVPADRQLFNFKDGVAHNEGSSSYDEQFF